MIRGLIALLAALWKSAAYEGASGTPLFRGTYTNQALAAAATFTVDVEVSGSDWLVVSGDLTGTASADLAITVSPFEEDGLTLTPLNLGTTAVQGPTLNAGHVFFYGKYDVVGINRVRITAKNNNAGAQTLTRLSWRSEGY